MRYLPNSILLWVFISVPELSWTMYFTTSRTFDNRTAPRILCQTKPWRILLRLCCYFYNHLKKDIRNCSNEIWTCNSTTLPDWFFKINIFLTCRPLIWHILHTYTLFSYCFWYRQHCEFACDRPSTTCPIDSSQRASHDSQCTPHVKYCSGNGLNDSSLILPENFKFKPCAKDETNKH